MIIDKRQAYAKKLFDILISKVEIDQKRSLPKYSGIRYNPSIQKIDIDDYKNATRYNQKNDEPINHAKRDLDKRLIEFLEDPKRRIISFHPSCLGRGERRPISVYTKKGGYLTDILIKDASLTIKEKKEAKIKTPRYPEPQLFLGYIVNIYRSIIRGKSA